MQKPKGVIKAAKVDEYINVADTVPQTPPRGSWANVKRNQGWLSKLLRPKKAGQVKQVQGHKILQTNLT